MTYTKPVIEKISTFKSGTAGLVAGSFRDIFGGRALGFIKDKKKTLTKKQINDPLSDKGRTNLIKNIEGKYGLFDAYAYLSFNKEKGIYQVTLEVDKDTSKNSSF